MSYPALVNYTSCIIGLACNAFPYDRGDRLSASASYDLSDLPPFSSIKEHGGRGMVPTALMITAAVANS